MPARFCSTFNSLVEDTINLAVVIRKDRSYILLRQVKLITNITLIFITLNYFAIVIEKKHCRVRFRFKHQLHLTFLIKPRTCHQIEGDFIEIPEQFRFYLLNVTHCVQHCPVVASQFDEEKFVRNVFNHLYISY